MIQVITIFKTDNDYRNREFIGIATDLNQMLYICIAKAGQEGITLGKAEMTDLTERYRTFGYDGFGEFLCMKTQVNKLINPNARISVLDTGSEPYQFRK